ncbi:nuclear transport factor 2 family protein [Streptomyces hoynatensis]|nr:nuclear transport factor 2 family protein [Streptomyces hoynatensis]
MSQATKAGQSTREVAQAWFDALLGGDVEAAGRLLAPDVRFINHTPVPGFNTDMVWIGTHHGRQAALDSFATFVSICDVREEELVGLVVDGEEAMGIIHEVSHVRRNGARFEIEFVQRLTVRDGRIVQWRSYSDSAAIVRALREEAS